MSTVKLALGLALALLSTLALNGGFLLQHTAAGGMPRIELRHPGRAVVEFCRSPRWLVGFVTGLVGWAAYVAALALAALSLVQTVSASGVALLAVMAVAFAGAVLTRTEWYGIALIVAGLAALGVSLIGTARHTHAHFSGVVVAIWFAVAVLVAALLAAGSSARRIRAASAGGAAAGVCYGSGDVATKALLVDVPHHAGATAYLASPYLYATLILHTLAFWLLQRAFQRGTAVAAVGLMTSVTNLLPIVGGVVVFGDPLPHEPALIGVRVAAFILVVTGATLLARITAEPPPRGSDAPRAEAPATQRV